MLKNKRAPWVVALVTWGLALVVGVAYPALTTSTHATQVSPCRYASTLGGYDAYLSTTIRSTAGVYFQNVPERTWTVLHYRIASDGTLLASSIVCTSGTPAQAALALKALQEAGPFRPLPPGLRACDVTELFWTDQTPLPTRGLAQELSHYPDGRCIIPIK